MTTFKKSLTAGLAALALGAALFSAEAEARPRYRGAAIGAGIVGALAVGGLLAATSRPAYAEPVYVEDVPERRCDTVERVNRYGEVVGYRRVCY